MHSINDCEKMPQSIWNMIFFKQFAILFIQALSLLALNMLLRELFAYYTNSFTPKVGCHTGNMLMIFYKKKARKTGHWYCSLVDKIKTVQDTKMFFQQCLQTSWNSINGFISFHFTSLQFQLSLEDIVWSQIWQNQRFTDCLPSCNCAIKRVWFFPWRFTLQTRKRK